MKRKFKFFTLLMVALLSIGLFAGCSSTEKSTVATNGGKSEKPSIIVFESPDCSVCKEQKPIWEKVSKEADNSKYTFVDVNIKDPKNQDVVKLFGVKATPTIAIVSTTSELVYVKEGLHSEVELKNVLNSALDIERQIAEKEKQEKSQQDAKKETTEVKPEQKSETETKK